MINFKITHEIYTPEDLEIGEPSIAEFLSESEWEDFRNVVDLLAYTEPSQDPFFYDESDINEHIWFTHYGEMDYRTGEYENRSYHPATKRDARYMMKAWRIANENC
jgi:hypothetical protein